MKHISFSIIAIAFVCFVSMLTACNQTTESTENTNVEEIALDSANTDTVITKKRNSLDLTEEELEEEIQSLITSRQSHPASEYSKEPVHVPEGYGESSYDEDLTDPYISEYDLKENRKANSLFWRIYYWFVDK